MKILFDHQCFWERYGGVSKYFVEIMKRIPQSDWTLCLKYTNNNEYVKMLDGINVKAFLPNCNFRGKATLVREIGKLFSIPSIIKGNYDIYHPTHYDTYGFPFIPKGVKTVTTIHDLNYYRIPEYYGGKLTRLAICQKKWALHSDHIITISENTKNDIIDIWNIDPTKISVIYHGINSVRPNLNDLPKRAKPYILFVGRRNAYKNFEAVIKAFAIYSQKVTDLELVCTGVPFNQHELNLLKTNDILNKTHCFQASEAELFSLYVNARMFIFPSFYEGFGMPILEAMSAGCPVLLSKSSCFPEIAQNAACYFNALDIDELISKIAVINESESYRSELISKGFARVNYFSWDKCAEQHLKVYKSIL